MDSILKLADQLGKAIADSAAAQDLQSTRQAMHTDPETSELLKKFVEQSNKLAKLSQEQKPIEPDDKRALDSLQADVAAQDAFKSFSAAQVEYIDLMRKVSQTILGHLQDIEGRAPQGGPNA